MPRPAMIFGPVAPSRPAHGSCGPLGRHSPDTADIRQAIWGKLVLNLGSSTLCTRTGLTAPYGKLGAAEHALLTLDVRRAHDLYAGHPFLGFFDLEHPEIVLPRTVPPVGLDVCPTLQPSFFKRSA